MTNVADVDEPHQPTNQSINQKPTHHELIDHHVEPAFRPSLFFGGGDFTLIFVSAHDGSMGLDFVYY